MTHPTCKITHTFLDLSGNPAGFQGIQIREVSPAGQGGLLHSGGFVAQKTHTFSAGADGILEFTVPQGSVWDYNLADSIVWHNLHVPYLEEVTLLGAAYPYPLGVFWSQVTGESDDPTYTDIAPDAEQSITVSQGDDVRIAFRALFTNGVYAHPAVLGGDDLLQPSEDDFSYTLDTSMPGTFTFRHDLTAENFSMYPESSPWGLVSSPENPILPAISLPGSLTLEVVA